MGRGFNKTVFMMLYARDDVSLTDVQRAVADRMSERPAGVTGRPYGLFAPARQPPVAFPLCSISTFVLCSKGATLCAPCQ
jgi:hypothetical protein